MLLWGKELLARGTAYLSADEVQYLGSDSS